MKLMEYKLGARSKINEQEGTAVICTAQSQDKLEKILDEFIEKWVVCSVCNLPETDLKIKCDYLVAKCNACGSQIKCEMDLDLSIFIFKSIKNSKKKSNNKI